MKILRMTAIGAALLVAAAPVAYGQGGQEPARARSGARGANRMMEMMFNGITLTDAQKAQIDSISTSYRSQMPAMQRGSAPDPSARQQRRELMQKEQADIRNVLTPDQQKVFDKNMASMRGRRRGGGGPGAL